MDAEVGSGTTAQMTIANTSSDQDHDLQDWITENKAAIASFVEGLSDNRVVRRRIRVNVERRDLSVSKALFWYRVVACPLTTQQKSGPTSYVSKFLWQIPFPLDYDTCREQTSLQGYAEQVLSGFGGLRRWKILAKEIATNLERLESGLWPTTLTWLSELSTNDDQSVERRAAEFFRKNLAGFGPKQARNLLQSQGLTRYETPIDSRAMKWLAKYGFPIGYSAQTLATPRGYNRVMGGIQALCRQCNLYPCVLDAAIFATSDAESWPEDALLW